jgi:hypothetical protein
MWPGFRPLRRDEKNKVEAAMLRSALTCQHFRRAIAPDDVASHGV